MSNPLAPLDPAEFDERKARHLLNRAGFGGTPAEVEALVRMGLDDAVDGLVEYDELPAPDDDAEFDPDIISPLPPEELAELRRARQARDEAVLERFQRERNRRLAADRQQLGAMARWWLRRMIETRRPLEEKMTLFWHGHFATGYRTIEDSWHVHLQNQTFRRHAVGSFRTLCREMVRDPALLEYLDNDENRRRSPNENFARELMELFVLGEGSGYSERDVKEAARALTGYGFFDDEFRFRQRQHDRGEKRILGRAGAFGGDDLVEILLAQPAASTFICGKLHRFFVSDPDVPADAGGAAAARREQDASRQRVQAMATLLRRSDFELRPMLKALFRSKGFYDEANRAALIKSPVQLVVQAVRTLGAPQRNLRTLLDACEQMGQALFQPPNVKGWEGGRSWINTSTLFVRQNVLVYILTGRSPGRRSRADGAPCDVRALLAGGGSVDPADARDTAQRLLRIMLAAEPRPERVDVVASLLDDLASVGEPENDRLMAALVLIAAMPEHQLH